MPRVGEMPSLRPAIASLRFAAPSDNAPRVGAPGGPGGVMHGTGHESDRVCRVRNAEPIRCLHPCDSAQFSCRCYGLSGQTSAMSGTPTTTTMQDSGKPSFQ
jgi:hypothetical protein